MYSNTRYCCLLFILLALGIIACQPAEVKGNKATPSSYDLNNPKVIKLSDRLDEVSGLEYYDKDSSVFAISDDIGLLFKILLRDKIELQHWKFGKTADYEGLALVDSTFYVLVSNGDLVAFQFETPDVLRSTTFKFPGPGKNEFEILYYDTISEKLVIICKDCEQDKKSEVSSWTFDPVTRAYAEGPLKLDAKIITQRTEVDEKKFKPSAAAIHPVTGELYIVSSINKALVIASREGVISQVFPLDPRIYKQPEGITFTPSGNMFISNEAADRGLPELLFYEYKNVGHEN